MDKETNQASSVALSVGTTLQSRYTIVKHLHTKKFNQFYLAHDRSTDSDVYIKELYIDGISNRGDDHQRVVVDEMMNVIYSQYKQYFEEEAHYLMNHDNIHLLHATSLFSENNTLYYVCDYVTGELLSSIMLSRNQAFSEREVQQYMEQMLSCLEGMHSDGFLHLDIAPVNLLLDQNGILKFMEYGHCKLVNTEKTVTYDRNHDPLELQSLDYNHIGPWTDFYILGSTLYNLLTGKRPPLASALQRELTSDVYKFPSTVSGRMQRLVLWMMTPNIFRRPQNVGEVHDFYNEIIGVTETTNSSTSKHKTKPSNKPLLAHHNDLHAEEGEHGDHHHSKWSILLYILLFGILFAVIGFFMYKYLLSDDEEEESPRQRNSAIIKSDSGSSDENVRNEVDTNTTDVMSIGSTQEEKSDTTKTEEKQKEEDEKKDEKSTNESQSDSLSVTKPHSDSEVKNEEASHSDKPSGESEKPTEQTTPSKSEPQTPPTAPESSPAKVRKVTVGSFDDKTNADARAKEVRSQGFSCWIESSDKHRVMVSTKTEEDFKRLKSLYPDAW